jgi:hypothetical protein
MLVRDTETIKASTGINKNIAWNTLLPFVMQAELKFAKAVLGDTLYALLDTNITNDSLTPEQEELLTFAKPMIANFSMYIAAPQLNIHISELGFQDVSAKEGTSSPTSVGKYNDARLSFWRTADDYREFTYSYLQSNQGSFPDWVSSTAYTIYSKYFFRSNAELNEYLGMGSSVSTFLTLRPHIKLCEEKYITPVLCEDFVQDLKTKNAENTLSLDELTLFDKIKSALAWLTIFEAAPTLNAVIEDGVLITALPEMRNKVFAVLTKDQISLIRQDAHDKGLMYLSALKSYLDKNNDKYPIYQQTDCFKLRQPYLLNSPVQPCDNGFPHIHNHENYEHYWREQKSLGLF